MCYRAKDIKEILYTYNRKGFFFLPGGGLKIELEGKRRINRVEFRPFVYDKLFWKLEDCPRVNFMVKKGKEFKSIETFSLFLDSESICVLDIKNYELDLDEFIISTEGLNFNLSISYIRIC